MKPAILLCTRDEAAPLISHRYSLTFELRCLSQVDLRVSHVNSGGVRWRPGDGEYQEGGLLCQLSMSACKMCLSARTCVVATLHLTSGRGSRAPSNCLKIHAKALFNPEAESSTLNPQAIVVSFWPPIKRKVVSHLGKVGMSNSILNFCRQM